MGDFTHFVGIDWSGARKVGRNAIAVAVAEAHTRQVKLMDPPNGSWSRQRVLDWMVHGDWLPKGARALIGFDGAFSFPFLDHGRYLTELPMADTPHALWKEVERVCQDDADLFGGGFVDRYASNFFQGDIGRVNADYRRFRKTEILCKQQKFGAETVFHLVGASQVGKASLSLMRVLNMLADHEDIAIWPFDALDGARIAIVEIFCTVFVQTDGHKGKVRDHHTLSRLVESYGARLADGMGPVDKNDNAADALISAAGMMQAAGDPGYWNPPGLSPKVARTEGWVFGIR